MLFDTHTDSEASLSTESNGQMMLFVGFVLLLSIRSFFVEVFEAILAVVSLCLSLIPSKSES
jgi:hypothetical protein